MRAAKTLRLYIARKFVLTIIAAFVLCATLIFMIDTVELLRESGKFGTVPAWMIAWMAVLRLPSYTEMTLPFAVMIGAIGAFLLLNRASELTVARASGMSVWQFVMPGVVVAFVIGVLSVTLYNPLAADARAEGERVFQKAFGRENNIMARTSGGTFWLRQDGADGQSVISTPAPSNHGRTLGNVMVVQYDRQGKFLERIDARLATLRDGYWELSDARISRFGSEPEIYQQYMLSTYLSPERVADALGTVGTVSFWQLPDFIELAEKAGLSANQYKVQYALLLSRPLLLVTMVLLAATVSLRSFRSGGIQTMVVMGMSGGLAFFLFAEVSRQIGVSGLTSAAASAWVPVGVAGLVSLTVLLHQEDG
jgi:lipopolysaccharide export system permease protein